MTLSRFRTCAVGIFALFALICRVNADFAFSTELSSGFTLRWNRAGSSYDFQAEYTGVSWIAVGVSASGSMVGTPQSNVVICPGPGGSAAQYQMQAKDATQFVVDSTVGTTNFGCVQSGSSTVMTWTRTADNGNVNDAQISTSGSTFVVYAVGGSSQFSSSAAKPFPMAATSIDFTQEPPSATSSISVTKSVTPSLSLSASPSPTYAFSQLLNSAAGLMLYWNRNGSSAFDMKLTYPGTKWLGMGISATGQMVATPRSNVIICPGSDGSASQYQLTAKQVSGVQLDTTAGVFGLTCTQTSETVMSWTRLADNGNSNHAQISLTGTTNVVYAIGKVSNFGPTVAKPSPMTSAVVNFVQSASPTISVTASISTTASITASTSLTPSVTGSVSGSASTTSSVSVSRSVTASTSISASTSVTTSVSESATSSFSAGASPTASVSVSASSTGTSTITATPTISVTPTPSTSITPTVSLSPAATVTASISVSSSVTVSVSPATEKSYTFSHDMLPNGPGSFVVYWNRDGNSFDMKVVRTGSGSARWIAFGLSENGFMVGSTKQSNVIVCPARIGQTSTGDARQHIITGYSASAITPQDTIGTTNLTCSQSGSNTVMTFVRQANNGNNNDAQISASGSSNVIFAVGQDSLFDSTDATPNPMTGTTINFMQTIASPSSTATVSPSLSSTSSVTGSVSVSSTSSPSISDSSSSSRSASLTASVTPTISESSSNSGSATASRSFGSSASSTPTQSETASRSLSISASASKSVSSSQTASKSETSSVTSSITTSKSITPTCSLSVGASPSATSSISKSNSLSSSESLSSSVTPTVSPPPIASNQAPIVGNVTMLTQDLVLSWSVATDGLSASFTATLVGDTWFGVSLFGGTAAVVCDPVNTQVSVGTVTSTGITPASSIIITNTQVTSVNGRLVMQWIQTLDPSSNTNDANFVNSGQASLSYYVGTTAAVPPPASATIAFETASVQLSPTLVTASCKNMNLGSGLTASWLVLDNSVLSAVIVLNNVQSWVGFGFTAKSGAEMVGGDAVIGRWGMSAASTVLEYALNGRDNAHIVKAVNQSLVTSSLEYVNGATVLKFVRPLQPNLPGRVNIPDSGSVTVLSAHGATLSFVEHESKAANKINFRTCSVTDVGLAPIKIAHAFFMAVGWGGLLTSGIMVAALGRSKAPTKGPMAWWFIRHKAIQATGTVFILIGFIIALVMKDGDHFATKHSKLGLAVMILGLLQPLNAVIRPPPEPLTLTRRIWSYTHKGCGYAAVIMSVFTIYLGIGLTGNDAAYSFAQAYVVIACVMWGGVFVWKAHDALYKDKVEELPSNDSSPRVKSNPAHKHSDSHESDIEMTSDKRRGSEFASFNPLRAANKTPTV